jgi:hypothetical protein
MNHPPGIQVTVAGRTGPSFGSRVRWPFRFAESLPATTSKGRGPSSLMRSSMPSRGTPAHRCDMARVAIAADAHREQVGGTT